MLYCNEVLKLLYRWKLVKEMESGVCLLFPHRSKAKKSSLSQLSVFRLGLKQCTRNRLQLTSGIVFSHRNKSKQSGSRLRIHLVCSQESVLIVRVVEGVKMCHLYSLGVFAYRLIAIYFYCAWQCSRMKTFQNIAFLCR